MISSLPVPLRNPIVGILHRMRPTLLSHGLFWREIEPAKFNASMSSWLKLASDQAQAVVVVNIAPTLGAIEMQSPGFSRSILTYNEIIAERIAKLGKPNVVLVDVNSAIRGRENLYINQRDGHHITLEGHELYGRLIFEAIGSFIDYKTER